MNKMFRRAQFVIVDVLRGPNRPVNPNGFVDIGPECFGTEDGSVLCYKGVNYTPQRETLRARLHNWLIRL